MRLEKIYLAYQAENLPGSCFTRPLRAYHEGPQAKIQEREGRWRQVARKACTLASRMSAYTTLGALALAGIAINLCASHSQARLARKVHDLSVCALFQDEAPYLREWLEFNKLQGVKHFYLYNNNSHDNYAEVLQPYILAGEVTLKEWPYSHERGNSAQWLAIQTGAFKDCLNSVGMNSKWMAFIDVDEFVFCPNGQKLPKFLEAYRDYGGLCVNNLFFGTSGISSIPQDRLMIEMLTHASSPTRFSCKNVKSIVQPSFVRDCEYPHVFIFKEGAFSVDAEFRHITAKQSSWISLDKIRLHHYWTRDENYFKTKKIDRRQMFRGEETELGLKGRAAAFNTHIDRSMLQFVPALRKKLLE